MKRLAFATRFFASLPARPHRRRKSWRSAPAILSDTGRGSTPDGVSPGQAFPAQLERLLRSRGCKVSVRNAGIAGDTTGGMLARLPGVLSKDTRVLILQPGGNDRRRGSGGDRAGNIAKMRGIASARGIKVVMLDHMAQIAGAHRLADGQHFSAAGHAQFAAHLAPQVKAAGACR